MSEIINFKKLASEKHRVYRILRAGPNVINGYRQAIAKIGNYRGAIIFPEQFIPLKDSNVFCVSTARQQDTVSIVMSRTGPFTLMSAGSKEMKTVDDVITAEIAGEEINHGYGKRGIAYFNLYNSSRQVPSQPLFSDTQSDGSVYWFSNKADAANFAKSCLVLG